MKVCARRFNVYFAVMAALALVCGCQSAKDKMTAVLRIHFETAAGGPPGTSQTISVLRSDPVAVTIEPDPILTEASIIEAKVADVAGGFAIELKFDETTAWMLEQYTSANPGRHFVIFGQWSDKLKDGRWLAAPLITHRITNGVLSFTPDCSRDEADRLVLGLNNSAKKIRKGLL
jgi:SecD-like export protein